jgi:dynactin complex subunit
MSNELIAEMVEWQSRCADLQNANERLREERDAARSSVDLLMHENHALGSTIKDLGGLVDRLRTHIAQGIEL